MANKDAAFGLRPVKHVSGSPFNGGQSRYRITTADATNTTKIYNGDIVTQLRQMQGRGPAAEAVAAQNHHAHQSNLVFSTLTCLAERARGRKRGAWLRRKRRRAEKQSPIRLNRLKSARPNRSADPT